MQLFFHEQITENLFHLDQEESKHLIKVLRKGLGDKVDFTDGQGYLYRCVILDPNPKKAGLRVMSAFMILKMIIISTWQFVPPKTLIG
jgi:16S rRNA (uracil1498-N3)-methyltransferase